MEAFKSFCIFNQNCWHLFGWNWISWVDFIIQWSNLRSHFIISPNFCLDIENCQWKRVKMPAHRAYKLKIASCTHIQVCMKKNALVCVCVIVAYTAYALNHILTSTYSDARIQSTKLYNVCYTSAHIWQNAFSRCIQCTMKQQPSIYYIIWINMRRALPPKSIDSPRDHLIFLLFGYTIIVLSTFEDSFRESIIKCVNHWHLIFRSGSVATHTQRAKQKCWRAYFAMHEAVWGYWWMESNAFHMYFQL